MDYLAVDDVPSTQRICAISFSIKSNKVIGFKIRGTYETVNEARDKISRIHETDPYHDIYIANTGYWGSPPGIELHILNEYFAEQGIPAYGPAAAEVLPSDDNKPKKDNRYKNHIIKYLDTSKLDPCPICCDILVETNIGVLPCLHMFCKTCVDPLTSCPVCRSLF